MRTTFNVAFYCRESKKGKDGKAAVEVSLSVNGERRFLNLPMKAEPKEFNKKRRSEDRSRSEGPRSQRYKDHTEILCRIDRRDDRKRDSVDAEIENKRKYLKKNFKLIALKA